METFAGFFTGSSVGYFLASIFGGPSEGQQGLINSIIFTFGNWQLHIHHWLYALFFLVFLIFFVKKRYRLPTILFTFAVGFFVGLIVQGLTYDDWYQVLIKNNL